MRHLFQITKFIIFGILKLPLILITLTLWLAIGNSIMRDGMNDLWSVLIVLLSIVCLFLIGIKAIRKRRKPFGNATFASEVAIARARLRWQGRILGIKNGRFIRFNRPGHLLTFAPTRSGKGVGVVIPNLLDHPGSVVVTDIKGENYRITADYRRTVGPVWAFAPFDKDIESACYNPIDFIRTGTDFDVDDARLIAEMIIAPVHKEPDHWEREARALMTGLLLFIATELPQSRRNLRELRMLLMRKRLHRSQVRTSPSGHALVRYWS